jgi:hypothetical protein
MLTELAVAVEAQPVEEQLGPPPVSNNHSPLKQDGAPSESELSDIEDTEEDIGEVAPAYYSDGGVPVFQPSMDQFKSFKLYVGHPPGTNGRLRSLTNISRRWTR